jgi:hypothetical protein
VALVLLLAIIGVNMHAQASSQPDDRALRELVSGSDVIFIGKVESLGEPGVSWSGRVPSFQRVTYQSAEYLKGAGKPDVTVSHVLVKGSPTAAPGEVPALSPKLFAKGARLIIFATRADDGTLLSYDERIGTLPHDEANAKQVRALLGR